MAGNFHEAFEKPGVLKGKVKRRAAEQQQRQAQGAKSEETLFDARAIDVLEGEGGRVFSQPEQEPLKQEKPVTVSAPEEIVIPPELKAIFGEHVPPEKVLKRYLETYTRLKSPTKKKAYLDVVSGDERKRIIREMRKKEKKDKENRGKKEEKGSSSLHSLRSIVGVEAGKEVQETLKSGESSPKEILEKKGILVDKDVSVRDARSPYAASPEMQGDMDTLNYAPEDLDLKTVDTKNLDLSGPTTTPVDIDLSEPVPASVGAEGTPKEWREKLRGLIEGAKEKVKWWKSSEEHLIRRSVELDAQAEKIGITEKGFRWLGEKYNKAGWKTKLGVGIALGLGAGISAPVSMTAAVACLSGIAAQRVAALATMYLKFEKGHESEKWGKEKAMAKAIVYTAAMTAGTMYAVEKVSESDWAQHVREWFAEKIGLSGTAAHRGFQAEVRAVDNATVVEPRAPGFQAEVRAVDNVTVEPKTTGFQADVRSVDIATEPRTTGFQSEVRTLDNVMLEPEGAASQADVRKVDIALETPVTPAALEMPSVEATKGKGYEYMMKRMWEQLQTKGLNPNDYAEGSDIRRLLEADAKSIDTVVHQIASDPQHTFYNPDGTSVRINLGDKMTINADGNVQLGDAVKAPEGAPVTPPYPPSPAVSAPSAPISPEQVSPTIEAQPSVGTQPPAPVEVVSGVLQEQSPAPVEERVPSPVVGENTWVNREGQPWRASDGTPITTGTNEVPTPPYAEGTIVNQFGLAVRTVETHIYADSGTKHMFVYGGSAAEQANMIQRHLISHPNSVVYGTDTTGTYRIPYHLLEGKVTAGPPARTSGLLGFFSTWMGPPKPDEFQKLIK